MSSPPSLPSTLRSLALASGGYATPALNDVLYAGGAGLGWIAGAEEEEEEEDGKVGAGDDRGSSTGTTAAPPPPPPLFRSLALYTALRALHLDRNGLRGDLKGWPALPSLAALHLADNALTALTGLTPTTAPSLTLLDISGNQLTSLESVGAGAGATLTCLRAARNPLGEGEVDGDGEMADPLAALASAPHLITLDLSDCGLANPHSLLSLLRALPALRCLAVGGANPAGGEVGRAFLERATTTSAKPPSRRLALAASALSLTYLDDAPIFGGERAAADAWAAGLGEGGAATARAAWVEGERLRRAELQGGSGLVDVKLQALKAGASCWVVEVPAEEEGA